MPPKPRRAGARAELVDGLRYTFGRPFTRAVLGAGVIGTFVFGGYNAIVVIFLYETVGLTEAAAGVLLGVGAAGAVVGALVTGPIANRIGDARLTWLAPAAGVAFGALVPLAGGDWRLVLFAVGALVADGLGAVASPRVALAVVMALLVLCPIWLRRSPVGRVRTLAELAGPVGTVRE